MASATVHIEDQARAWRAAVVRGHLTGTLVLGSFLVALWLGLRSAPRFDGRAGSILVVLALLAIARFWPGRGYRLRAIAMMVVFQLGAIVALGTRGLSAGPALITVHVVVIGAVIFGRRVGGALLAVAVGEYLIFGVLFSRGIIGAPPAAERDPTQLQNWLSSAFAVGALVGLVMSAVTALIGRMEHGYTAAANALESAQEEQRQRLALQAEKDQAERAFQAAQRMEAVGRLASGIAHDLNNALVVIMGWNDLLSAGTTAEDQRDGQDAIRTAAGQAAQLTRGLLAFAKADVSEVTAIVPEVLIQAAVRSLRPLLPADIDLVSSLVPTAALLANESQLGQVLLNIMVNARDALPRGGVITLGTRLVAPPGVPRQAPDPLGSYVEISVSDNGVGMDAETQSHIFEPFFSTKGPGRGTGMGLASVHGIVKQSGGYVHVESVTGRGTTFVVAFPVAAAGVAPALATTVAVLPQGAGRKTVLLVDDDDAVRQVIARATRRAGIEVIEAASGAAALEAARRHRGEIHALCTDAIMPGLPTTVLIEGFKALFPRAPVLVCSGHLSEDLLVRGVGLAGLHHLGKPFTGTQFVEKLVSLWHVSAPVDHG